MKIEYAGETVFVSTAHRDIDGERPSIVFLHGAGFDHAVWLVYERYFARQGFNAISLDLPGHGRSGGAPLESIPKLAAWVGGVVGALGVDCFSVVGHSMGSLVALECAAQNDAVERAVLVGFTFPMAVGPALLDAAKNNDPAAIDMMVIFGHSYRSQLGGNRVSGVHVVNTAKRFLERNAPGVLYADLNACHTYDNGEQAIADASCPVTIISGTDDKMTPSRSAAALAAQFANGQFVPIADSGHGVMAEQPEALHHALRDALVA